MLIWRNVMCVRLIVFAAVGFLVIIYLLGQSWQASALRADSDAARYNEQCKLTNYNIETLRTDQKKINLQIAQLKRDIRLQRDRRDEMSLSKDELQRGVVLANETVVTLRKAIHSLELQIEDVRFQQRSSRKLLEDRYNRELQRIRTEIEVWRAKLQDFIQHIHAQPQPQLQPLESHRESNLEHNIQAKQPQFEPANSPEQLQPSSQLQPSKLTAAPNQLRVGGPNSPSAVSVQPRLSATSAWKSRGTYRKRGIVKSIRNALQNKRLNV